MQIFVVNKFEYRCNRYKHFKMNIYSEGPKVFIVTIKMIAHNNCNMITIITAQNI